jgi:NADP-dependent 3-hydroxy acid dehydrogenase YdfG
MTYAVAKGGVIPPPAAIMRGNRAVVQHRAEIDCDDAVHVVAFTKSLAREVARHSINVNCACPGPTDTPMLHSRPEKLKQAFLRAIPFRRFAKPQGTADAVLFFASPRSDYIIGQVQSVSGGLTFAG